MRARNDLKLSSPTQVVVLLGRGSLCPLVVGWARVILAVHQPQRNCAARDERDQQQCALLRRPTNRLIDSFLEDRSSSCSFLMTSAMTPLVAPPPR
jgi:hypothetical protein